MRLCVSKPLSRSPNNRSMSETNALDVLHAMTEADRAFYQALRFMNNSREQLMVIHQRNTATMLGLIRTHVLTAATPTTATFSFPMMSARGGVGVERIVPAAWGEPVIVNPSREQIDAATERVTAEGEVTCAICQESIEDDAIRLTHCRHEFHNHCITEWFTRSVHCPNCRHDIREGRGQSTSSVAARSPPPGNSPRAESPMEENQTLHTEDIEESYEHHA
jgi:Ring finger domain